MSKTVGKSVRPSSAALLATAVGDDGLLDDVVAEEEVGGHDVGRVPPQVSIPTVDLKH